jgi:hypothetical protein
MTSGSRLEMVGLPKLIGGFHGVTEPPQGGGSSTKINLSDSR